MIVNRWHHPQAHCQGLLAALPGPAPRPSPLAGPSGHYEHHGLVDVQAFSMALAVMVCSGPRADMTLE